jgi:hypothetical protein
MRRATKHCDSRQNNATRDKIMRLATKQCGERQNIATRDKTMRLATKQCDSWQNNATRDKAMRLATKQCGAERLKSHKMTPLRCLRCRHYDYLQFELNHKKRHILQELDQGSMFWSPTYVFLAILADFRRNNSHSLESYSILCFTWSTR